MTHAVWLKPFQNNLDLNNSRLDYCLRRIWVTLNEISICYFIWNNFKFSKFGNENCLVRRLKEETGRIWNCWLESGLGRRNSGKQVGRVHRHQLVGFWWSYLTFESGYSIAQVCIWWFRNYIINQEICEIKQVLMNHFQIDLNMYICNLKRYCLVGEEINHYFLDCHHLWKYGKYHFPSHMDQLCQERNAHTK